MTSIVMHYAPPAACGQTRHFNYCALVDGDMRREGAHTDPFYSPHLSAESCRSPRRLCFINSLKSSGLWSLHVRRRQEPFCVPVRTTLRRDSEPGGAAAAGCHIHPPAPAAVHCGGSSGLTAAPATNRISLPLGFRRDFRE